MFKPLMTAAALTLAAGAATSANDQTIGTLDAMPYGYSTTVDALAGSFTYRFVFDLSKESVLAGTVDTSFLSRRTGANYLRLTDIVSPSFSLMFTADGNLDHGSPVQVASLQSVALNGGSAEFLTLEDTVVQPASGSGLYFFQVSGVGAGSLGGKFDLNTFAVAVPEASTQAMALAGLGVIGLVARRRHKA